MKKYLFIALMALIGFSLYSCGDEEIKPDPNNGQGNVVNTELRNTKWMGIVDCMDYVKVYEGTIDHYTSRDSLMACHDTIYIDFGVDVEYPTFSKLVYLRDTNQRKRALDIWFDYQIKDGIATLSFRSNPPYDPGYRELKLIDDKHMKAEERDIEYELIRIK